MVINKFIQVRTMGIAVEMATAAAAVVFRLEIEVQRSLFLVYE